MAIVSNSKQMRRWLERVDGRFMGTPLDVHPHEAILWALRIAAGEVLYCDQQISRLCEDELFERPVRSTYEEMPSGKYLVVEEKRDPETMNRWVYARDNAADRMARYAKMAIDANVDEREVAIAEQQAQFISKYFEAVVDDLHLSPEQVKRLGPAMRRHLALVEGVAA